MNKGGFLFSPSGVHLAYLMLYVVIPAVTLYVYDLQHSFGHGISFYISDKGLFAILLSVVGFAGGALITGKAKKKQLPLRCDLYRRSFAFFSFLAVLLTLVFVARNVRSLGALNSPSALSDPEHYAMMQEWKAEAMYGSTYLLQGVHNIFPFIALFFLARHYCGEGKKCRNWAAVLIIMDVVVEFALGGLWVGFALLVMALMLKQYFRPATNIQMIAAGTVLSLVVFGSLLLKFGGSSMETDDEDTVQLAGMAGQRFASGAATIELMLETYPRYRGYEYGLTYVRDAVSLIPSPIKRQFLPESWWGGFNGLVSSDLGFYGGTGQVPVMGEFYANFGMAGVLVGSVAYGTALQKLSNVLRCHALKRASTAVFIAVLGYRLAEATVEGVGGRFPVSCLWIAIFLFCQALTQSGEPRLPGKTTYPVHHLTSARG
jgi:oligosaccharide repeat unit polymerase